MSLSTHTRRTMVWVALVTAYWFAFAGVPGIGRPASRLDPLAARPRAVERAIAEKRFPDALPIAVELARLYPADPLIQVWLASIYRGLHRPADEAAAWETFVAISRSPADACPALPHAYEAAGDSVASLRALERCVGFDPRQPERLVDLASGLERQGKLDDALAAARRAAELDPKNPWSAARIERLLRRMHHDGEGA